MDWGMKNRLSQLIKEDGHCFFLPIDHGYFQGPTTGLERVDVNIVPLVPYADALMLTRGILRSQPLLSLEPPAGHLEDIATIRSEVREAAVRIVAQVQLEFGHVHCEARERRRMVCTPAARRQPQARPRRRCADSLHGASQPRRAR